MLKRTSCVDWLQLNSVGLSSVVEIGDSSVIQAFSRALALQREQELFSGHEGEFNNFPIFSSNSAIVPITQIPNIHIDNTQSPKINVKNLNVNAVSSAAIVHIGSSKSIQMETRIKHIRHLLKLPEDTRGSKQ
jgi:spore germination protein PE